jgi:hypothetical protein
VASVTTKENCLWMTARLREESSVSPGRHGCAQGGTQVRVVGTVGGYISGTAVLIFQQEPHSHSDLSMVQW